MEHKVTKIRRFLEHEMHKRHENNKNQRKTLFCKASVLARLCLRLFFHFLQTSLHPAEEHPQTALMGLSLQKRKYIENRIQR